MQPDYSARKLGLPTMPVGERLKAMSIVNSISGCWEWQGVKHNGYGRTTTTNIQVGSTPLDETPEGLINWIFDYVEKRKKEG